jgi:nucleoid-associated protein YgaU
VSTISRYSNRRVLRNNHEIYQSYFDERGIKQFIQYNSPNLSFPTKEQIATFTTKTHLVNNSDRLSTLAFDYYEDATLWWVIAWFNKKPGDFAIRPGDVLYIPFPLEHILATFGY